MGMKISVLYLGRMEFPKFRLVQWDDEVEMIKSPAVAILIQHPTLGNLLYDTGNSPDHARVYTPDMLHNYPVVECISIKEALAAKGPRTTLTGSSSPTCTLTTLRGSRTLWVPRPSRR